MSEITDGKSFESWWTSFNFSTKINFMYVFDLNILLNMNWSTCIYPWLQLKVEMKLDQYFGQKSGRCLAIFISFYTPLVLFKLDYHQTLFQKYKDKWRLASSAYKMICILQWTRTHMNGEQRTHKNTRKKRRIYRW